MLRIPPPPNNWHPGPTDREGMCSVRLCYSPYNITYRETRSKKLGRENWGRIKKLLVPSDADQTNRLSPLSVQITTLSIAACADSVPAGTQKRQKFVTARDRTEPRNDSVGGAMIQLIVI